jgi:5-methylcytosine-specific restriction endonuclease McrA
MRITKTPPTFPNFEGYKSQLKTLWKRGKLKTVTRGLYGDILTKDNLSLEHLKPHSKGGRTALSNLALASKDKNNFRNSKPLKDFLTSEMVENYLKQFKDIHARGFSGNKYIEMLRKTFKELL